MIQAAEIASISSPGVHTEYIIKRCKVTHSLESTVASVDVLIRVLTKTLKHSTTIKGQSCIDSATNVEYDSEGGCTLTISLNL